MCGPENKADYNPARDTFASGAVEDKRTYRPRTRKAATYAESHIHTGYTTSGSCVPC